MSKQITSSPKVKIESIEFCKPLREGIITLPQITHQPLVNLEQAPSKKSKKKRIFELNVITFLLESLDICPKPKKAKGNYHAVPIDTSIPYINEVKDRIWFGYLGQFEDRHHFDLQYNDKTGVGKDYMLVYLRVKYSVKYPKDKQPEKEQILLTENYDKSRGKFEPETDRGTKTSKRIRDEIG